MFDYMSDERDVDASLARHVSAAVRTGTGPLPVTAMPPCSIGGFIALLLWPQGIPKADWCFGGCRSVVVDGGIALDHCGTSLTSHIVPVNVMIVLTHGGIFLICPKIETSAEEGVEHGIETTVLDHMLPKLVV